jgi:hypothetical protein
MYKPLADMTIDDFDNLESFWDKPVQGEKDQGQNK